MTPGRDITPDLRRLETLIEAKFGIIRGDFPARAARARGKTPPALRPPLDRIARDARHRGHPTLARMIDEGRFDRDIDTLTRGLKALDLADARRGFWLGLAGALSFNLLLLAGLLIAWVWYRGLLAG